MILPCPNCSARFLVDPVAIGRDGRRVRCGRCGHTWHQSGVSAETAEQIEQTVPEFVIRPRTPGANLPALRPKPRSGGAAWLMLLLLVVVIAGGAFYAVQEMGGKPGGFSVESILKSLGLGGQPQRAERELDIPQENIQAVADGKAVVVSGVVVNRTDQPRDLPKLKLIFLNADKTKELGSKVFSANAPRADAKAAVKFEIRVEDVPAGTEQLSVTFDK